MNDIERMKVVGFKIEPSVWDEFQQTLYEQGKKKGKVLRSLVREYITKHHQTR